MRHTGRMTVTEIDHDVALTPTPAPPAQPRPRWVYGVVGVAIGVLLSVGVSAMRPHATAALAAPVIAVPQSSTVTFKVVGNATVDFAGIWTDGRDFTDGEVDPQVTYTARAPYTVVFTVRSDPGEKARCQIFIDGKLATEKLADDESATCVLVR